MDGAETEGSPRALSEAASDVPGAAKVAVHDVSASRSAASTQPPLDLRTIGQHLMASTDTGSFQRQLQQTTPLRHHDVRLAPATWTASDCTKVDFTSRKCKV